MTIATQTTPLSVSPSVKKRLTELRDVIKKTVGTTFFGPVLRTMRNSELKGTVGHGGRGEEVFQNQLDQIFAERLGSASNFDLHQVLYDRFSRRVAARAEVNR